MSRKNFRKSENSSRTEAVPHKAPDQSFARAVYMLMPMVVYYVIRLFLEMGVHFWIRCFGGGSVQSGNPADYTWILILTAGLVSVGLWLVFRKSEPMRSEPAATMPEKINVCLTAIVLGILLAQGLNIAAAFILRHLSESMQEALNVPAPQTSGYLVGLILYGLFSPLTEELLFRWLLLNRIERVFRTRMAIVLSALFFGIYHGNLMQGIYAFLMGLVLAYICVSAKSLPAAFLFHASANAAIYSQAFLPGEFTRIAGSVPAGLICLAAGICILVFFSRRGERT